MTSYSSQGHLMKIIFFIFLLFSLQVQAQFIKVDATGAKLADDAKEWSCVYDESTNLLWENKTEANKKYTYNWYSPSDYYGLESKGDCQFQGKCDTDKYVKYMQGLCGVNDWRLPDKKDLESLVVCPLGKSQSWVNNYECNSYQTDGLKIKVNATYFPNMSYSYWSNDVYEEITSSAYYVNFYTGGTDRDIKSTPMSVMLVRSGYTPTVKEELHYPTWDSATHTLTIPKFDASAPVSSAKLRFDFANGTFEILESKEPVASGKK